MNQMNKTEIIKCSNGLYTIRNLTNDGYQYLHIGIRPFCIPEWTEEPVYFENIKQCRYCIDRMNNLKCHKWPDNPLVSFG